MLKDFLFWTAALALSVGTASCGREEGSWNNGPDQVTDRVDGERPSEGEELPGGDVPAEDDPGTAYPDVIFFDNFDSGSVPDPAKWKLCGYAGVAWAQYFKNTEGYSNVRLENGCLVLTADKVNGLYRNGGVRTVKGFGPGTIVEVRARFFKGRGGFPAIWQMPVGGLGWPDSGEIDILEWVQGTPGGLYQTVHSAYNARDGKGTGLGATIWHIGDFENEFHTYAAARDPEAIYFFADGELIWQYDNLHLGGDDRTAQFPFIYWNYDIILNYSLGGYLNGALTWPGEIDDDDLPVSMYVDWVRVRPFDAVAEGVRESF